VKIAIIGSGIAGNVAAYHLHRDHDITVFEAGEHVGGHTHTHDIEHEGQRLAVDTGFIVCNDRTYPNFLALMSELGVELQDSEMDLSISGTKGVHPQQNSRVCPAGRRRRHRRSKRTFGSPGRCA